MQCQRHAWSLCADLLAPWQWSRPLSRIESAAFALSNSGAELGPENVDASGKVDLGGLRLRRRHEGGDCTSMFPRRTWTRRRGVRGTSVVGRWRGGPQGVTGWSGGSAAPTSSVHRYCSSRCCASCLEHRQLTPCYRVDMISTPGQVNRSAQPGYISPL